VGLDILLFEKKIYCSRFIILVVFEVVGILGLVVLKA